MLRLAGVLAAGRSEREARASRQLRALPSKAAAWSSRAGQQAGACRRLHVTGPAHALPRRPRRMGVAWAALAAGCLLWGFAYSVHTWPRWFRLAG